MFYLQDGQCLCCTAPSCRSGCLWVRPSQSAFLTEFAYEAAASLLHQSVYIYKFYPARFAGCNLIPQAVWQTIAHACRMTDKTQARLRMFLAFGASLVIVFIVFLLFFAFFYFFLILLKIMILSGTTAAPIMAAFSAFPQHSQVFLSSAQSSSRSSSSKSSAKSSLSFSWHSQSSFFSSTFSASFFSTLESPSISYITLPTISYTTLLAIFLRISSCGAALPASSS